MSDRILSVERTTVGQKTKVSVSCDGILIGSRTSHRTYRFALVVTGNQEYALEHIRSGSIPYAREQIERYEALAKQETASKHYIAFIHDFSFATYQKDLRDGSFVKWAEDRRQELARLEARVKEMESGILPKFNAPMVASWHQARHLVPNIKNWQKFVAIIEIPA